MRLHHARALSAVLAVMGWSLTALAPAAAADVPSYGIAITQQLFDSAGNPWLIANTQPDGSLATPSWSVCAPGKTYPDCTPTAVTSQSFAPGPTAAGTSFFAGASIDGGSYGAQSDPWLGQVAATAPPTLTGAAKVGARVTPAGGAWTGGWGGEFDVVHVEACRTADGRGCATIAHPWAMSGAKGAVTLDARVSGRYLFAFDARYARATAFPAIGYPRPSSIAPATVGATVARSAPLGPVTGPKLVLREHPLLQRDDRLLIGRATCVRRCRVVVSVSARGSGAGASIPVRGTRRLALAVGRLRLDRGLTIRVRIGRTPPVTRTVQPGEVVAAGRR